MSYGDVNKYFSRILSISILAILIFVSLPGFSLKAKAASYTVNPENGVLLSCNGTEVFADADASTYVKTLPVNTPVLVTGRTSNGFWQVNIDNGTYFIYQMALSTLPNTYAYRLTSFDARAALVGNAATGELIYHQGALDKLEPASTAKIMTALLVAEAIEAGQLTLQTPVAVSATAMASIPSDASHVSPRLQAGEILTIEQLLTATMVSSDCHSCNVLAEALTGSVGNFVALMNARASQMGCVNTNFTNPSGYPDKKMYTNAYSLYIITLNAIQHPVFNQFFGQSAAIIPATNMCATPRQLVNTDSLIVPGTQYYNPAVTGGKTGTTNTAGQCLVATANSQGKTVITIVLGCKNRTMFDGSNVSMRYAETNRLIGLGLGN